MAARLILVGATRALGPMLLLAGCDDHVVGHGVPPPPEELVCSGNDTWETFGSGFMRTWCHSCHSSELADEYRYGAPPEVNFDRLQDVQAQLETSARGGPGIIDKATGSDPSMPPAGGIKDETQAQFDAWIGCGAPGEGTPTSTSECTGPEITGDRTVDSEGAAAALCAEGTSIAGTLTVSASATIDCLCAVDGDLNVTGAAVDVALPALSTVGGSVRADAAGLASLTLAEPLSGLHTVGGDLLLEDLPALTTVRLGELEDVTGDFLVSDDGALTTLDTPRLTSVGGSVRIERNDAIVNLDLPMLEHVGVDFVIAANPALENMSDVYDLRDVGGSLVVADNDAWELMFLSTFGKLATIGDDLIVDGNAIVIRVTGFTELATVGGSVRITNNLAAGEIDGFDNLLTVGEDLEVRNNPELTLEDAFNLIVSVDGELLVVDNPKLAIIAGLSYPTTLGGLRLEGLTSLPDLKGFGDLTFVGGDLRILRSGAPMFDISGFSDLTSVAGTLEIDANVGLANLTGFVSLTNVGADLEVTDNPLLSDAEAQSFADGVTNVGGSVVISGNGG